VTKFHQNRLTLKGRSAGQRHTDRQTDRQTRLRKMALQVCSGANRHRHTSRLAFTARLRPPGPNAPSSECLSNVVPNSEFGTCPDPEFPNTLHSEFMNTPNVEFLNVPLCSAPMSYLAANGVVRCPTGTPQRIGDCSEHAVLTAGA